ncbi:MAG: EAL domain-containing protein [Gammaproteobacteria bacterium]|nr:EAL domain-containing protein [Gammaproteobacteria bacterium]
MDTWVLDQACRQFRQWRSEGLHPGRLAVNVSSSLFRRSDLIRIVAASVAEHRMTEGELELELAEAALVEDTGHARDLLVQLGIENISPMSKVTPAAFFLHVEYAVILLLTSQHRPSTGGAVM